MAMANDGGCTFAELCTGTRSYACDNTVNIKNLTSEVAEETIIQHIYDCIRRLEEGRGETVKKFFIAKAKVQQKKRAGGKYVNLDPQNSSTYTKSGISDCWDKHKCKYYGRDGMVVLTIVTEGPVPQPEPPLHQEDYTRALKSKLYHYFKVTHPDPRCANQHPSRGKHNYRDSPAYALCMAFSLEEPQPDKPKEEGGDTRQKTADQEMKNLTEQLDKLKT